MIFSLKRARQGEKYYQDFSGKKGKSQLGKTF